MADMPERFRELCDRLEQRRASLAARKEELRISLEKRRSEVGELESRAQRIRKVREEFGKLLAAPRPRPAPAPIPTAPAAPAAAPAPAKNAAAPAAPAVASAKKAVAPAAAAVAPAKNAPAPAASAVAAKIQPPQTPVSVSAAQQDSGDALALPKIRRPRWRMLAAALLCADLLLSGFSGVYFATAASLCAFFLIPALFERTLGTTYGLPRKLWLACRYNHQGRCILDMTTDRWLALPVAEQIRYAGVYQKGCAEALGVPVEVRAGGSEFAMRLVPPGRFWMGSPKGEADRSRDETRHRVVIGEPFWMQKTAIKQAQWRQVTETSEWNGQPYPANGGELPMAHISWNDVTETFLPKLGKGWRLPTEAQWEYACRAGTTTRFPWGDSEKEIDAHAHTSLLQARSGVAPVGQLQPNGFGLFDMIGNVWEWCSDWYAPYPSGMQLVDPQGSAIGSYRVDRGGSWRYSWVRRMRSSFRGRDGLARRGLGARLVWSEAR